MPPNNARKVTVMWVVETANKVVIALRRRESDAIAIQVQLAQEGIKTTVRKCFA